MTTHELARQLLSRPDADANEQATKRLLDPSKGQPSACWCGCGQQTKSRFVPGHDSRFHGHAKRAARGEEALPEAFVHAEAEADYRKWHDTEKPLHEAREAEKAKKKADREAAKAAREAA